MGQQDGEGQAPADAERRRNLRLRSLFDSAYPMVEHFLDPAAGWGGSSREHVASRLLRENFPDFSPEELHAIVVAAHRVYISRNPEDSEHLSRPEDLRRRF